MAAFIVVFIIVGGIGGDHCSGSVKNIGSCNGTNGTDSDSNDGVNGDSNSGGFLCLMGMLEVAILII